MLLLVKMKFQTLKEKTQKVMIKKFWKIFFNANGK